MEDWKIIGQSRTGIDLEVQKGLLECFQHFAE